MNVGRFAAGLALLLILVPAMPSEVLANPSDFLIRSYTISVTVDSMDEALRLMESMPGLDLSSEISIQAGWGRMERMIANRDMGPALASLNRLGQISSTHSQARNVFAIATDLQSELQVRSDEHGRLMELLLAADTFTNFQRVENRLVQVISEMESLQGRLNHLDFERSAARVHITLSAAGPVPEPVPEPEGVFGRIAHAFAFSANASLAVIQAVLVVFAYISVPLALAAAVSLCVWQLRVLIKRKGGKQNETVEENKAE